MDNQLTGRVFITIKGIRQRSLPGATLDIGGLSRTMKTGDDSVHGHSSQLNPASVSFNMSHRADTKMKDYQDMVDIPLDFESDTGVVYRLTDATCMDTPKLSGGEVPLRFDAISCEEM